MNKIDFIDETQFNSSTQYYSEGFESKLYRYIYNGNELLIKKYYDFQQININKIEKVSLLETEELLKPIDLVNIDNTAKAFSMNFKRGFYPLTVKKKDLNDHQKCEVIMKLKQILSALRKEGCLYGDLSLQNVLTDGEEVYLCDSVNVQIDEYPFDEITSTMRKYIERAGTTDGIDIYMLNLLTVYLFNEIEYDSITENIELVIMNMFNMQPYNDIVGVTDSLDTLNVSSEIFLSNRICDKLLIDYMDINLKEEKTGNHKV